jgi:hypothetical protein
LVFSEVKHFKGYMMHNNISTIIQKFEDSLILAGYKRSSFTGSLFLEADNFLDKAFCIQGLSSSVESFDQRGNWQPASTWSGEYRSTLQIEVLYKLRTDVHNADYKAKTGSEEEDFIRAVLAADRTGFKFFVKNITRSLTPDRTFISIKYNIEAIHRFSFGAL